MLASKVLVMLFDSSVNDTSVVSIRHTSFPLTSSSEDSTSSTHSSSSSKRTLEPIFFYLREVTNILYVAKCLVPPQLKLLSSSFFSTRIFLELPASNFLDVGKPNFDFLRLLYFFHSSNFPKCFTIIATPEASSTYYSSSKWTWLMLSLAICQEQAFSSLRSG